MHQHMLLIPKDSASESLDPPKNERMSSLKKGRPFPLEVVATILKMVVVFSDDDFYPY